ncbi:MAG: calcium-binding protein [Actinomycetota bacterium]
MRKVLTAMTVVAILAMAAPPSHAALTCDGKVATIVGTSGNNILVGTPGNDVIVGLGGNDTISGLGGNDRICGGSGNDVLLGGTGNDRLSAQGGLDELFGGSGDDTLSVFDNSNVVADTADGGTGFDACAADVVDIVVGCEPVAI